MISENRQHGYGKVFNDVRLLSTDDKPLDVRNGSTLIEIDTGKRYLFDAEEGAWHEFSSGGGGSANIDLGITDATVGQVAQVASVDEDGAPQSWSSLSVLPTVTTLDAPSTLTVQNMVEYHFTNVTTLAISYPQTPFDCWISLTTGASVDVSLPASEYVGDPPVIGPYEKWELSIRNGVVVAGKAVADA